MPMRLCHPRAENHYRVKEDGAAPTFWIPSGCSKAWMEFLLPSYAAHSTHVQSARQTSWHRLHDARRRCALSPSRSRPPQCPHAHSKTSKSRKNRSHLIPTLIPTLLIKEGRVARGSRTRDPDQRRSLPHWGSQRTCCVCANLHMYHAPCAVLRYSGLLFGTGQRIAWLACSGARTKATRKAKAGIALAQRDYRMATRPHGQTAALADEQDRPSELAVVIPRSHRPTGPCSDTHTHARPLWGVRWLDVRNTTLGLLVPEHRQGSYPVPCRWKDEPG